MKTVGLIIGLLLGLGASIGAAEADHVFCVDATTRRLVFMTPPAYDPANPPPEIGRIYTQPTGRTLVIKVTRAQYEAGFEALPPAIIQAAIDTDRAQVASLDTLSPELRAVIRGVVAAFNARLPAEQRVTDEVLRTAIQAELSAPTP